MTSLVLLTLLAGADLSMKDLQALSDDGAWGELLEKATMVAPSERGPGWKDLVTRAAVKSLEGPVTGVPFAASEKAQHLAERYAFLPAQPTWLAARDATIVKDLKACMALGAEDACWNKEGPWEAQLTGAGALEAAHAFVEFGVVPYRPMPLFAAAVAKDPKACGDEKLPRVVTAALSTPPGDVTAKAAVQVLETCWGALGTRLVKTGWSDDTYFLTNACPTLLKKNVLSELRRDLCADAKR